MDNPATAGYFRVNEASKAPLMARYDLPGDRRIIFFPTPGQARFFYSKLGSDTWRFQLLQDQF